MKPTHKILVAGIIGALLATATVAAVTESSVKADTGLVFTTPAPETSAIANPERGWYRPYLTNDFWGPEKLAAQNISVVLLEADLGSFLTGDISEKKLTEIRSAFQTARNHNLSVIFRAGYTFKDKKNPEPTKLETVIKHIAQLAPVFREFEDILVAVQAGFLGPWGEWHSSRYGNPLPVATQKTVVDALLAAVPTSVPLEIRRPSYIRQILGETINVSHQTFTGTASRLGYHNDCFLAAVDDMGTYVDKAYDREAELAWANSQMISVPFTAETCQLSNDKNFDYSGGSNAIRELGLLHAQQLNIDYNTSVIAPWKTQMIAGRSAYDTITDKLGYRFVVTRVGLNQAARSGGALHVRLELENQGFGNLLKPHAVQIVLSNGSTTYRANVTEDPRTWRKESGLVARDWYFSLPASLSNGNWTVSLALPSTFEKLENNSAYAIRLANAGVWNQVSGSNTLGTVSVQSASGNTVTSFTQISVAQADLLDGA